MNAKDFLAQQKQRLLEHAFFSDRFIATIANLEHFDSTQAQLFAKLYYPHILRTRLYQANALGITPDENVQFVLAEILYDEYGQGNLADSHMELYRKFMRATGITEEGIKEHILIPELTMYVDTMMRLTQTGDWLAAVAAVGVASEHPIPKYYGLLLQGLRKIPNISDDDLELFIGHMELDVEHARQIEKVLLPYLDDENNQIIFIKGLDINMNARRVFHEGLYREVFTTD